MYVCGSITVMNIFTNYFAATVSLRHLEERILQWLRRRRPLLGIVNHEVLREQATITQCRILKKTKIWRSATNNSRPAWERVHLEKRSEWVGSAALERIEESGTAFEPLACFSESNSNHFLFFYTSINHGMQHGHYKKVYVCTIQ